MSAVTPASDAVERTAAEQVAADFFELLTDPTTELDEVHAVLVDALDRGEVVRFTVDGGPTILVTKDVH